MGSVFHATPTNFLMDNLKSVKLAQLKYLIVKSVKVKIKEIQFNAPSAKINIFYRRIRISVNNVPKVVRNAKLKREIF